MTTWTEKGADCSKYRDLCITGTAYFLYSSKVCSIGTSRTTMGKHNVKEEGNFR